MKIIIAGATGMVGELVLKCCLNSTKITEIISLVRKPTTLDHPNLKEISISDFENYSEQEVLFEGVEAAFFCIGVYTGQVSDILFKKITVNYAVAFAKTLEQNSPKARFCLLSGAGVDRTQKSRTAFARYKGIAENQITVLELDFYTFRPAYIFPVIPRREPNLMYKISRRLYPFIKLLGENFSIKSTQLAEVMFRVGLHGADQEILENKDILKIYRN